MLKKIRLIIAALVLSGFVVLFVGMRYLPDIAWLSFYQTFRRLQQWRRSTSSRSSFMYDDADLWSRILLDTMPSWHFSGHRRTTPTTQEKTVCLLATRTRLTHRKAHDCHQLDSKLIIGDWRDMERFRPVFDLCPNAYPQCCSSI